MCRPVYPYELGDPDFSWLLSTFQEANPEFALVDAGCLPLVLVKVDRVANRTIEPVPVTFDTENAEDKEPLEKN